MNSSQSINSSVFNGKEQPFGGSCSSHESTSSSSVAAIAIQLSLSLLVFLVSVLANAFMCFLLARVKQLQTVPNILVADLAIVDLLNVLINGPLFVCYVIMDLDKFRGKLAAWYVSILHVFFAFLTLATMLMMMVVRYLVISRPLKYRKAQMKKTIFKAILIKWSFTLVIVMCVYGPLFKLDLGACVTIVQYRESYTKESKQVIPRIFTPLTILGSFVLYILSRLTLRKKRTAQRQLNLVVNRLGTPKGTDHKALNTIILTLALFVFSYAPVILRSLYRLDLQGDAKNWLAYILSLFLFLPNVVNPFLYFVRARNFRKEINQLWEKRFSTRINHNGTTLQSMQDNSQRTSENQLSENPRPSHEQGLRLEDITSSEKRCRNDTAERFSETVINVGN